MTQDEIISMALNSCDSTLGETAWDGQFWTISQGELERFAALVAAHEREACAKVCEEFGEWRDTSGVDCAAAIRARSQNGS